MQNRIVVPAAPGWTYLQYVPERDEVRSLPVIAWEVDPTGLGGSETNPVTPIGQGRTWFLYNAIRSPDGVTYSHRNYFACVDHWLDAVRADVAESAPRKAQLSRPEQAAKPNFGERMAALKAKKAAVAALNA